MADYNLTQTGAQVQQLLDTVAAGYIYMGVADLTTTPDTTNPNVCYLLKAVGTYTNFGNIQHASGIGIAIWNGTAWSYQNVPSAAVVLTDATLTENSTNPVQGGVVYNELEIINNKLEATPIVSQQVYSNYADILGQDNKYITTSGTIKSSTNYFISIPFDVKQGDAIRINGLLCAGACSVAKVSNGVYTPLITFSLTASFQTIYTITEDCSIVISGDKRYSFTFSITRYDISTALATIPFSYNTSKYIEVNANSGDKFIIGLSNIASMQGQYLYVGFSNTEATPSNTTLKIDSNASFVSFDITADSNYKYIYLYCNFSGDANIYSGNNVEWIPNLNTRVSALESGFANMEDEIEDVTSRQGTMQVTTSSVSANPTTKTFNVVSNKSYELEIINWSSEEIRGNYSKLYLTLYDETRTNATTLFDFKGTGYFPNPLRFSTGANDVFLDVTARTTAGVPVYYILREIPSVSIFDNNPYEEGLIALYNIKKTMGGTITPLTLLHFSDIHGDGINLQRVCEYKKTFDKLIDDVIHTGDAVKEKVSDGTFDFWSNNPNAASILNVIGNHDVWYADGFTPTANYPYNTYFKPYIDNNDWGTIVQPTGAESNGLCYYYKDYTSNHIRLIVLDYRDQGSDTQTWLSSVLDDAKTNGLSVVIAVHYMPTFTKEFDTGFNTPMIWDAPSPGVTGTIVNIVESFISGGGEFVCWICGHEHKDYCGVTGANKDQVVICVDCQAMINYEKTRYRSNNTRTQDAFNLISFNTYTKTIQVFRVGNYINAVMSPIHAMCIDYKDASLLFSY